MHADFEEHKGDSSSSSSPFSSTVSTSSFSGAIPSSSISSEALVCTPKSTQLTDLRSLALLIAGILNGIWSRDIKVQLIHAIKNATFDDCRNKLITNLTLALSGVTIRFVDELPELNTACSEAQIRYLDEIGTKVVYLHVPCMPIIPMQLALAVESDVFPKRRQGTSSQPIEASTWLRGLYNLKFRTLFPQFDRIHETDSQSVSSENTSYQPIQKLVEVIASPNLADDLGTLGPAETTANEYKILLPAFLPSTEALADAMIALLNPAFFHQPTRKAIISFGIDDDQMRLGAEVADFDIHRLLSELNTRLMHNPIFPRLPSGCLQLNVTHFPHTSPANWSPYLGRGAKVLHQQYDGDLHNDPKVHRAVQVTMILMYQKFPNGLSYLTASSDSPILLRVPMYIRVDRVAAGKKNTCLHLYALLPSDHGLLSKLAAGLLDPPSRSPHITVSKWSEIDSDQLEELLEFDLGETGHRSLVELHLSLPDESVLPEPFIFSRYRSRLKPHDDVADRTAFVPIVTNADIRSLGATASADKLLPSGMDPLSLWLRCRSFAFSADDRNRLFAGPHIAVGLDAKIATLAMRARFDGSFAFSAVVEHGAEIDATQLPQQLIFYWHVQYSKVTDLKTQAMRVSREFGGRAIHRVILHFHSIDLEDTNLLQNVTSFVAALHPQLDVWDAVLSTFNQALVLPQSEEFAQEGDTFSLAGSNALVPPASRYVQLTTIPGQAEEFAVVQQDFHAWLSGTISQRQDKIRNSPPWEFIRFEFIAKTSAAGALQADLVARLCLEAPIRSGGFQIVRVYQATTGCGATAAVCHAVFHVHEKGVHVLWIKEVADESHPAEIKSSVVARLQYVFEFQKAERVLVVCDNHIQVSHRDIIGEALRDQTTSYNRAQNGVGGRVVVCFVTIEAMRPGKALRHQFSQGHRIDPLLAVRDVPAVVTALKKSLWDGDGRKQTISDALDSAQSAALSSAAGMQPFNRHLFVFCLTASRGTFAPPMKWIKQVYEQLESLDADLRSKWASGDKINVEQLKLVNFALTIAFPSALCYPRDEKNKIVDTSVTVNLTNVNEAFVSAARSETFQELFPSRGDTNVRFSCVHPFMARLFLAVVLKVNWNSVNVQRFVGGWTRATRSFRVVFPNPTSKLQYVASMLTDRGWRKTNYFTRLIRLCLHAQSPGATTPSAVADYRYDLIKQLIANVDLCIGIEDLRTLKVHLLVMQSRASLQLQQQLYQTTPEQHLDSTADTQSYLFSEAIRCGQEAETLQQQLTGISVIKPLLLPRYQLATALRTAYRYDPRSRQTDSSSLHLREARRKEAYQLLEEQFSNRKNDSYKPNIASYLVELSKEESLKHIWRGYCANSSQSSSSISQSSLLPDDGHVSGAITFPAVPPVPENDWLINHEENGEHALDPDDIEFINSILEDGMPKRERRKGQVG